MKLNFIPLDYDYFDFEGKNYAKIIGRDDKGKRVCLVDYFEPYFYAILKENVSDKRIKEIQDKIEKIKIELPSRTSRVIKTEVKEKNFLNKNVQAIKIFISNFKDGHAIADYIDYEEISYRREYDIGYITKYIIERKLNPLKWYEIDGEILNNEFGGIEDIDVDICLKIDKISEIEDIKFKPRILAFDIEAEEFEIGKGEILMISLVGENFRKVLTYKNCSHHNYVECFKDEAEMIEKFVEYVQKFSPDLLVGYFSDGFDMAYLKARAEKNKVRLKLGLDNSVPCFAGGRTPKASLSGVVHVDLFKFIESIFAQYLQSESLGLDDVARELLGEGKKEFEFKHSSKIKEHEWNDFYEYNLQDSILTFRLAEKFWPDMVEFCRIIQEPLFDITRDSMSAQVENYILHHLTRYNEISEKRPLHDEIEERRARKKYEGAFVFTPIPGLYDNLCFFDFTSMYGSVIVSYNLSKSTFSKEKQKDYLEVELEEGKAYFYQKEKGFFSDMLEEIIQKRKKYKSEYKKDSTAFNKARSNAYKLLANAAYGYQGFFGARYYCIEAAASTAALARKSVLDVIEKIKAQGYEVIYSDTDSIAFLLNNKSKKETLEFLERLNKNLPGIMELELEDFYKRGIWVSKRTGESGAKKKYALITENNKLKIRGFETVRRDWCDLARKLQSEVLEKILNEGNEKSALELIKKIISDLKNRKIEREEIMIRTNLKKPISEYKSITPHVIAAKKMQESGIPLDIGMSIEYFIAETREKKSLVREKVKLAEEKGEYNIEYYLKHQILPAVENILEVFNIKALELAEKNVQRKLF